MKPTITIYFSSLGIEPSFSDEQLKSEIKNYLPSEILVRSFGADESNYYNLLPDGIGGDGFPLFFQMFHLVILAGSAVIVQFAHGFFGESGKLLAQKLFKPIEENERKRGLAQVKSIEPDDHITEAEIENTSLSDHLGDYTIKIHVKELNATHNIIFLFDGSSESVTLKIRDEKVIFNGESRIRETHIYYEIPSSCEEFWQIMKENMKWILEDLGERIDDSL